MQRQITDIEDFADRMLARQRIVSSSGDGLISLFAFITHHEGHG